VAAVARAPGERWPLIFISPTVVVLFGDSYHGGAVELKGSAKMKPFLIAILAATGVTTCACSGSSPAAQPMHNAAVTARPRASTPAPAPTPSSAPGSPAAASCLTRDLTASTGSPQGFAGGLEVAIVFKNTGHAACTLYGYPGVAQAAGTPVTTVGRPSTENPATPRTLVMLPPDGNASALLRIADSAKYPDGTCKPVKATWLEVIPPSQKAALKISFGSTACKGNVKLLSVTTVQQGSAG
jgi:Protein of unknown function (DUF4232)